MKSNFFRETFPNSKLWRAVFAMQCLIRCRWTWKYSQLQKCIQTHVRQSLWIAAILVIFSLQSPIGCIFLPFCGYDECPIDYLLSANKISCPWSVWWNDWDLSICSTSGGRALSMNSISSSQAFIFLTNCKQYNNNKIGDKFDKSVGKKINFCLSDLN